MSRQYPTLDHTFISRISLLNQQIRPSFLLSRQKNKKKITPDWLLCLILCCYRSKYASCCYRMENCDLIFHNPRQCWVILTIFVHGHLWFTVTYVVFFRPNVFLTRSLRCFEFQVNFAHRKESVNNISLPSASPHHIQNNVALTTPRDVVRSRFCFRIDSKSDPPTIPSR